MSIADSFRKDAEQVDRIGDRVGPNDMALSNRLWAVAGDLRRYADKLDGPVAQAEGADE